MPADVMNDTDVGMVQTGNGLRFAFKTAASLGTVRDVLMQKLARALLRITGTLGFLISLIEFKLPPFWEDAPTFNRRLRAFTEAQ